MKSTTSDDTASVDWNRLNEFLRETFLSAISDLLYWILGLLLITWPFEFIFFSPLVLWQNALWRIAAIILIGVYLTGIELWPKFRRWSIPVYIVFVTVGMIWLGHVVGRLPERLFLTFLSIMAPFPAMIVPLRLFKRLIVTSLFPAALISSYYYTRPSAFADPTIVIRLLFVLSSVVLCILLGNVLYVLLRRNYRNRERMDYLANHDAETGLFNSEYFRESLSTEIERAKRYDTELSLAYIRMNDLDDIREEHGQDVLKSVLERFGDIVMDRIRTSDLAGRINDNDFCVILPETGEQGSETFAERMKEEVTSHTFLEESGGSIQLECQVELARLEQNIEDSEQFIDRARTNLN